MKTEEIEERTMKLWIKAGWWMSHRPFQIIGLIVGCAIVIAALAYSTYQTSTNDGDINDIQKVLCSTTGKDRATSEQKKNCQRLLDQLLDNATPSQTKRLREIVKETS